MVFHSLSVVRHLTISLSTTPHLTITPQISINQAVKDDSPRKIYITGTKALHLYV